LGALGINARNPPIRASRRSGASKAGRAAASASTASIKAELAKRRAAGLTPAQEDMLARWGYPYVGPEFRFHLTLSGALPSDIAARVEAALAPLVAPLVDRPMAVREVCLFGEDASDGRFRVIRRFPLA
ncbi:MAG: DUF1045 domain-containing protein, partial [Pseudomonadota bacterium]